MNTERFAGGDTALQLHCIGVQFSDAPRRTRDQLALAPEETSEALATLATLLPRAEGVVVATCNRTEVYVVEAGDPERVDLWHRTIGHRAGPIDECPAAGAERFHLTGSAAVEHLLRVVCGLESAELGDTEILGQVRRARQRAVEADTVGPVLHRLFDVAARTGARARQETDISSGGAGVGLATAEALEGHVDDLGTVTVIGAGDAADAICRELVRRTGAQVCVVNRTAANAEELARRHGVDAAPITDLIAVMAASDAVVTAVHGDRAVIDRDALAAVRDRLPGWDGLIVDTCVPAMVDDVDARVLRLPDITERRADLSDRRRASVSSVEAIVAEATDAFATWFRDRALDDVIGHLFSEAEALTASAAELVDDDRTARELRRAVRRLVHHHITRLRSLQDPLVATRKEPTS